MVEAEAKVEEESGVEVEAESAAEVEVPLVAKYRQRQSGRGGEGCNARLDIIMQRLEINRGGGREEVG